MYIASNLTLILSVMRELMIESPNNLEAYIVPSGDAHQTEFIAECHERRAYISGFTGSAGTAIVTKDKALLWTDGRYFLQDENQLPEFWTLMKSGQAGTPSQSEWLKVNLQQGARVGVDPTLYSKRDWDGMQRELESVGMTLVGTEENLVDKIWEGRPPCGSNPVYAHGLQFSGKRTNEKLVNISKEMEENGASVLLITELDEVAWLLNLRGSDIPFSSIFFGYVIVTDKELHFFVNPIQLTSDANSTLQNHVAELKIQDYDKIFTQLKQIVLAENVTKVWYTPNTNYALVKVIEEEVAIDGTRRIIKLTPISLMKAIKNPTEVSGYKNALLRDSAAICEFLAWVQEEIEKGTSLTEISAAKELHEIRSKREHFVDDSFPTISAAGPNGAIIHYMPTPETDRKISSDDMYLLDSGGLYRDGTTDITRTIHFGTPSQYQKDCYTRVLKGHIALARAIFPNLMVGSRLDSFARQFLWEAGLDYNHGTGHGVGSFLNVHEGPFGIGSGNSQTDPGLRENFFTSNEPGYYEDNAFGIRLENAIRVKNVSLEHNFLNRGYLGFEDVTLVPYDHKLIDFSLLTEDELEYLNDYQEKIRNHVGNYMKENGMSDKAQNWMMSATVPVTENGPVVVPTLRCAASWMRLDILLFILPGLLFYLI